MSADFVSYRDADALPLYGLAEAWWKVPGQDEAAEKKFIERLRARDTLFPYTNAFRSRKSVV